MVPTTDGLVTFLENRSAENSGDELRRLHKKEPF